MISQNCEGIILSRRRYSETSWTLTAFTRENGRLDLLAKGARRPGSPMRGHLDLLNRESLLVYERPNAGLDLLAESYILDEFTALRRSPLAFAGAGLLAEAARHGFAVRDPHPGAYGVLAGGLERLAAAGGRTDVARATAGAMEALLRSMGYAAPEGPFAAGRIARLAGALGRASGRPLAGLAVWQSLWRETARDGAGPVPGSAPEESAPASG